MLRMSVWIILPGQIRFEIASIAFCENEEWMISFVNFGITATNATQDVIRSEFAFVA